MRMALSLLLLLLSLPPAILAQEIEGYRLERAGVVVDRAEEWEAWEKPDGATEVSAEGVVRPRFLRRAIDAMENAGAFDYVGAQGDTIIGGVQAAGSADSTAHLAIDGDPETYWEPDAKDQLSAWYVEIDLGRSVIAQRVVVRFADSGDPFLKFRVLAADGLRGRTRFRSLNYFRVGQVAFRNKEQREFSFEVRPRRPQPDGMEGEVVQVVRIEGLDTDGVRGEEVGLEVFGQLDAADRGAIDFYRKTVTGRQILIDEQTYRQLPDEERGEIRYFRRERPRLAEIEVHTLGDNIVTLTQREKLRDVNLLSNALLVTATDGRFPSSYFLRVYNPLRERSSDLLEIDLGAQFWLDRIRMLSQAVPIRAYQLRVSDGSQGPTGERIWEPFEERLNREGFMQLEEAFPLQPIQFIELRRLELSESDQELSDLAELQAFGEGYVSDLRLTSPIIRPGGSTLFTRVNWEADVPPGTQLELRTRSGDLLEQEIEYYAPSGREIGEKEWLATPLADRGPRIVRDLPGSDWSDWSAVYRESGEVFKSPSPRLYSLIQARLLTTDPQFSAQLRRLELELAPPLVDQVLAEIWPTRGVEPGVDQEFDLYVRPRFAAGDDGFDRIRIRSTSTSPIEMLSLHEGTETQLRLEVAESVWPGKVEVAYPEEGVAELIFAEPVTDGNRILAARFRTRIFLSGTSFSAELSRQSRPGIEQQVREGNVVGQVPSQSLVVLSDLEGAPLLGKVETTPRVLTPNGDGINDEMEIRFVLFRLRGARTLHVELFDLGGRRVRDLSLQRQRPSGEHAVHWDGRDEVGGLVAPGTYLVRVRFGTDADASGTQAVRLIHVAY